MFICNIFNDAASSSDYIVSDNRLINELQMMRKEAAVT
jgi:hypothetical protein